MFQWNYTQIILKVGHTPIISAINSPNEITHISATIHINMSFFLGCSCFLFFSFVVWNSVKYLMELCCFLNSLDQALSCRSPYLEWLEWTWLMLYLALIFSMLSRERTPRLRIIIFVNDRKKITKNYCILHEVVRKEWN